MGAAWWIAAGALLAASGFALAWIAARPAQYQKPAALVALAAALTLVPNTRDAGIVAGVLGLSVAYLGALRVLARVLEREVRGRGVRWVRRARVSLLRMPGWAFGLSVFGAMFVAASTTSWLLFRHLPVIQDTQAQLFHARIFASGAISGVPPPPALAEFFEAEHVIVRGGLYSQYPPGHTVFLTLGVLAGAPWAVNPALGGIALVLVWRIGRALFHDQTGRRAALVGLASPFLLFMSSEYMNHATMLVMFAVQVLATIRALRASPGGPLRGALAWAALAGIAVGWQALIRPLSAVGLAAPLGILVLAHAMREPRRHLLPALVMAAAAAGVAALMLVFNNATTGSPLLMGYTVRWGAEHTIGFGIAPWGPIHTPARGLENTLSNLDAWNLFLLGGPLPASVLIALGVLRDRRRAIVWALAAGPLCVLALYFPYFGQDLTFGPRYLYEASLFGLLMIARALGALPRILPRIGAISSRLVARRFVGWATAIGMLFAALFFVPGIAWEYANVYALHGGVVDRAEARIERDAIVFLEGSYQKAFYAVEPTFSSRILFVRDLGDARDRELACAYPERELWVYRSQRLQRFPGEAEARAACP